MREQHACRRSYKGARHQGEFGRAEHRFTSSLGDLKSITSGSSALQGDLAARGANMLKQTRPVRNEALSQLLAAMQGGKVAGRIPMIQQAVSQSNQASATAQRQTAEGLAQRNVGGPFAASALGQLRQQGLQTSAAIPTQMSQQIIGQYLPFAGQVQQMGMGAFSTAAQSQQQLNEFNASQRQQSAMGGGGGILGIICLEPDARIDGEHGSTAVQDIVPGDTVWSIGRKGEKILAKVMVSAKRYVGSGKKMLLLEGPTGPFLVSPNHPDVDGKPLVERFPDKLHGINAYDYTCDIQVDSFTGAYFVNGFPMGSTLDG